MKISVRAAGPLAFAAALLASQSAHADCTPQAASNVTASCTAATVNQGGGAPGTSAGSNGYGSGAETGITVNVADGATVSGSGGVFSNGIIISSGTINNGVGSNITGARLGMTFDTATVTNAGTIAGTSQTGIFANVSANITNYASGTISGGQYAIGAGSAAINVTNFGTINGPTAFGILGDSVGVTNHAGASITGYSFGIGAVMTANVTNSGTIAGSSLPGVGVGVNANTGVTVTNNAGGSISGGLYGIASIGGGSVVNTGSISGGAAAISFSGGNSSVFNAGTISVGSGLYAISFGGSGNTLTLAPGSVISGVVSGTGNDTFQLGGSGTATFDLSRLGPAQYAGFGTFNKIGDSTWTATGSTNFAGQVNVDGGKLLVNGNMTGSSSVSVNAGGTLGGNGTVGNTTINGGTLSPGNSIGTLTVAGNLVFSAAASYMVEVSPANADRTNVTGRATLGGATVNASFASGTYVARQYTIVNATGGISGTFGSVANTNLPGGFHSSLSYDASNAYLDLTLDFTPTPTPNFGGGLSGNQQAVGNALINFFNSTGGIPIVFGTLTPAGLTQASGETAVGSQQTTFDAMNQFMGVLTDPFLAGRGEGAASGAPASTFASEAGAGNAYAGGRKLSGAERDAYAAVYQKAPLAQTFDPRWSVWAAGFGGSQTTDGNAVLGSNNATSRLGAVAAGADYRFSPDTIAGFALAGGGTSFSVDNGGSGRSDLFQAGAFVRHTMGAAYIAAAAAYGFQDITTDRTVTIAGVDRLHAEFSANAYSGRAEAGYRLVTPWAGGVGVTPYAAGQFTTFDLPAYAESVLSGAANFALAYAAKTVTDSRSELGLRSDKSFYMPEAMVTLRGRLAWAHDFNPDRGIAATFQTLPGASFVVNGAAQATDSALTTASAEIKWRNGWSAAATFEGEFSDVTRSYAGKGVVRYAW